MKAITIPLHQYFSRSYFWQSFLRLGKFNHNPISRIGIIFLVILITGSQARADIDADLPYRNEILGNTQFENSTLVKGDTAIKVSGVVLDENDTPLQGATVQAKGVASGVSTDANGAFSIQLPSNAARALTVSFIGMETQEVRVTGQGNLVIRLQPVVTMQDEW